MQRFCFKNFAEVQDGFLKKCWRIRSLEVGCKERFLKKVIGNYVTF